MNTISIGELCEFTYGKSLSEQKRSAGKVLVYGSNGVVGRHNRAITSGPTIVIGRKGSIGEINWSGEPCFPIDTTYYVSKTKRPCDLRWLYYILQKLNLTRLNKSSAVPGLNRDDAYAELIPFPDISEQQHLAARLDQADHLRRIRRYALELSDNFLSAIHLEFFDKSERKLSLLRVEELAADQPNSIRTGPFGSQLLHSEFTDDGIAVLGIDNAVNNRFTWGERRFIAAQKYEQLKRYTVRPADVVITIMGTCGRCAIIPDNIPIAINTKHLCCITLDQKRCLPAYLHSAFLHHPFVRHQLRQATKGAIMEGVNMEIIRNLHIPIPSLTTQEKFAKVVNRIERLFLVQQEALRQAEHLFQSLLHAAFSGDEGAVHAKSAAVGD